jgi:hypothetical protein
VTWLFEWTMAYNQRKALILSACGEQPLPAAFIQLTARNSPMRVVFWTEYLPPYIGGVERNAQLLLPELHRRGIELLIVTSHHYLTLPDEESWQGIRVHRFAFTTALEKGDFTTWFRQQQKLAHLLDNFNPALYHIFSIGPSMVACLQLLQQQVKQGVKQQARPLIVSQINMQRAQCWHHPQCGRFCRPAGCR